MFAMHVSIIASHNKEQKDNKSLAFILKKNTGYCAPSNYNRI